jgi:hypothetical protein
LLCSSSVLDLCFRGRIRINDQPCGDEGTRTFTERRGLECSCQPRARGLRRTRNRTDLPADPAAAAASTSSAAPSSTTGSSGGRGSSVRQRGPAETYRGSRRAVEIGPLSSVYISANSRCSTLSSFPPNLIQVVAQRPLRLYLSLPLRQVSPSYRRVNRCNQVSAMAW